MIDDRFSSSSQIQTTYTSLSNSASSDSEAKYGGLIDQTTTKILRRDLTLLFSYVYSVAPSFEYIHNFITFIRIFQYIIPSFCIQYPLTWNNNSFNTLSLFSIFGYLFPPFIRENIAITFLYIYFITITFLLLFLFF